MSSPDTPKSPAPSWTCDICQQDVAAGVTCMHRLHTAHQPTPAPAPASAETLPDLLQSFDEWEKSTEFTRTCKSPVNAGDQMALRDAHELLADALRRLQQERKADEIFEGIMTYKEPEESAETLEQRQFPIQIHYQDADPHPTRIPWSVADKAYAVYAARYGKGQSLERLAERGGFSAAEMDDFYPTWRTETNEIEILKEQLSDALRRLQSTEQFLADLQAEYQDEHDRGKAACDECEECSDIVMCQFHSLLSLLFKGTWTSAAIERDQSAKLVARLQSTEQAFESLKVRIPGYEMEADRLSEELVQETARAEALEQENVALKIQLASTGHVPNIDQMKELQLRYENSERRVKELEYEMEVKGYRD